MRVFPAYAGMFPTLTLTIKTPLRFPRIRGDVPGGFELGLVISAFSPHTRGCSVL